MQSGLVGALLLSFSFSVLAAEGNSPNAEVSGKGEQLPKETLVKWGQLKLTQADFDASLTKLPPDYRDQLRGDIKRVTAHLENMLVLRSLADEARILKLDQEPLVAEQIQLEIDRLLAKMRIEQIKATLTLPDLLPAAQEYYKLNQKEFEIPESVQAAHVLIRLSRRTPDEAKELAESIRSKALAGASFEDLALEYSEEPNAKMTKGHLGSFTHGKMVKEFEQAAFSLQNPGDISEVVKTAFGFHVIKLLAKQPARTKAFSEVEKDLVEKQVERYKTARLQEHLSTIKNNQAIQINKISLDALATR